MKKTDQVQVLFPCECCAQHHRIALHIDDKNESTLKTKLPFEINKKSTFIISPDAMKLLEDNFGKDFTEHILTIEILPCEYATCKKHGTAL